MLADRVQERVELSDLVAVALAASELGVQVGQVALQQDPVEVGERADTDALAEQRESGQGALMTLAEIPQSRSAKFPTLGTKGMVGL